MFWIDFKQILSLVVVHSFVVGQLKISFNWVSSSSMHMMDSTLWHLVKNLEEFTTLHHFFVLEEVMDGSV